MRHRAYTLLEVLAVTVLLGLLVSLGAPPLLRVISGDPLERAAGQLAVGFRDARAQAYGRQIRMQLEPWGFTAVPADAAASTTRIADDIAVIWTRKGHPIRSLDLDPRGHGLDAEVALRRDERTVAFTVDGLTGRWLPRTRP